MAYYKPLRDVAKDYINWAISPQPRIATGFQMIDSRTSGGIAAGEVLLFTARSGVGKTAVAGNIVINDPKVKTVFFSLEMHGRYIAMRLAAMATNTPTRQIEEDLRTTERSMALQRLVEGYPHIAIVDKPAMSLKEMGVACAEIENEWQAKPDLIVIDFLELIGGVASLSAVEKIDQVARKVKDFARERDAAVVLLHQVGRGEGGAGAEPLSMASGRYGGETYADYVIGAYRVSARKEITQAEYEQDKAKLHLQFLKTRSGGGLHPGGYQMRFHPETMRISEWDYRAEPLFSVPA